MTEGFEAVQNSQMINDVNNFYMNPAVSKIMNNNNPLEDAKKNDPVSYYAGIIAGNLAQAAAGNAVAKGLGLTDEVLAYEPFIDDATLFSKPVINNFLDDAAQVAYNGTVATVNPVINYKPSSGAILKATPGKTTTILGSYDKDMQYIVDELGNVKSEYFGYKIGGYNVLNVPDELYIKSTFWNKYNKPWLEKAIIRGDDIYLATKPESQYLSYIDKTTGEEFITGFGREYKYLREHGYAYDITTKKMILNKG